MSSQMFYLQLGNICPVLESTKKSAKDNLHSLTNEADNCTLMLLSNLREPGWVPVNCKENLLHFSICKASKKTDPVFHVSKRMYLCKSTNLLWNEKCYILRWNNTWNTKNRVCGKFHERRISRNEFDTLHHIFDVILSVDAFSRIILQEEHKLLIIKMFKLFENLHFEYNHKQNFTDSGYTVCKTPKSQIKIGINIFHCKMGGYILQKYVCDEKTDGPNDRSDEDLCICNEINKDTLKNIFCNVLKIHQSITYCMANYYVGTKGVCKKYDLNDKNILENLLCSSDKQLKTSSAHNIQNCRIKPKPIYSPLPLPPQNILLPCRPYEIPCMDSTTCFNIKSICLFELDTENEMIPCKTGDHLQNCVKFECNILYKCPGYYCIPWSYVCDAKWDCPHGEDETNNDACIGEKVCYNIYKCRDVVKCIHLSNVCDGKLDCPKDDDEMFCDLKSVQCPESCNCLTYALTCAKLAKFSRLQTELFAPLLKVTISESIIQTLSIFEHKLQDIYFVYLPKNNIKNICPLFFLKKLLLLDLQFNYILQIMEKCFSVSIFLRCLRLNNNNIAYLNIYSFHDLHYLRFLDLSSNPFITPPSKCFYGLLSLKVLHFGNIRFKEVHVTAFTYSNIKIIKTLDHKLSCISLDDTYCTANPPLYIICSDILPGISIKVIYIIVSLSAISLNILSVLLHVKKNQGNDFFKIKVIELNFTDILCGLYLLNMWLSDLIFQSTYFVQENLWKSHRLCFVGHGFILWFTISNQISLFSISTARFIAIVYPLKSRTKSHKNVLYQVRLIHLFALSFSIFFTLIFLFTDKQLPTSLCLPFIDTSGFSIISKLMTYVNIISQSIVSCIISTMHIFLIVQVNRSERSIQISQSLNNANRVISIQLILTSTSIILCWFPVNAIYISVMFLPAYPNNLLHWTTGAIMPLNSIMNPCIFMCMKLKNILHY